MKALVLCAGYGRRLGTLCADRAKPLLEVGDRAIVEHILGALARHGICEVHLNLHHHAQQFRNHLGSGARYGLAISFSYEQSPLGTAGTLRALREHFDDGPLLVHYGDVLTEHDLASLFGVHCERSALATLLVHRRRGSNSYAHVDERGLVKRFVERPRVAPPFADPEGSWAFSGLCVLSQAALDELDVMQAQDLPRDAFPRWAAAGNLWAQSLAGYRCAVDSPERLKSARKDFDSGRFGQWRIA
ncbi:MAG: nucleotidyltransferase family protein [Proteobacteria bacterium]|nr:nucleotidyltransferase family protein [Pseudomonadota bacterium]